MRYLPDQKEKVKNLRKLGKSLNEIVGETQIPKSTIREWLRDVSITTEQKNALYKKSLTALQAGKERAKIKFTSQRQLKKQELFVQGIAEIGTLSKRELFLTGIALYWAEGFKNKHEKRLGFCNSDPKMILFYLNWLEKALGIKKTRVTARLTLNIDHKNRHEEIVTYWQKITGLSSYQFTKTFYQNVAWKKQYKNSNEYFGVLRLHVKESLDQLLLMRGWIEGLSRA